MNKEVTYIEIPKNLKTEHSLFDVVKLNSDPSNNKYVVVGKMFFPTKGYEYNIGGIRAIYEVRYVILREDLYNDDIFKFQMEILLPDMDFEIFVAHNQIFGQPILQKDVFLSLIDGIYKSLCIQSVNKRIKFSRKSLNNIDKTKRLYDDYKANTHFTNEIAQEDSKIIKSESNIILGVYINSSEIISTRFLIKEKCPLKQ